MGKETAQNLPFYFGQLLSAPSWMFSHVTLLCEGFTDLGQEDCVDLLQR